MVKKQPDVKSSDTEPEDEPEKWIWATDDPLRDGIAGDIAKLFKAESFDKPGVLAENAPSNEAALFAREAIQNSWDAAREWRDTFTKTRKKAPDFSIQFKFEEIKPGARLNKVFALGLNEHSRYLDAEKARKKKPDLGLANADLLTDIFSNGLPLKFLTVTERAGLGMPGHFDKGESRMMKALLRVGQANTVAGAGGAFGFGKAGLIAASATRIVFAYSAFKEVESEPGVTRRLLGVTYWKGHKRGAHQLSGWARFGSEVVSQQIGDDGSVTKFRSARPFINEEADDIAQKLGLDVRDVNNPAQTGTTFLLVDPTITANDLKIAVERYWWPAMIDTSAGLKVEINDYDGTDKSPEVPTNDPNLKPFIEAFEIASRTSKPTDPNHGRYDLGAHKPQQDPVDYTIGVVGLVAEPEKWSFPEANDGIDHKSMVALIRGPQMIVNYRTFSGIGIPHVRGLFIADESIDDLLRQTEDSAHTKWDEETKTDHPSSPIIAKEVKKRLREAIVDFRQKFAPPPPKPGDSNLPVLDELSKMMKGKKKKIVPPDPRQILVRIIDAPSRTATKDNKLVCHAKVGFQVADWVWELISETTVEVNVSVPITFVEVDDSGDHLAAEVICSNNKFLLSGASSRKQSFVGPLGPGETVQFTIKSEKYSPDWTVRFSPSAVITEPKVPKPKSVSQ